MKFTQKQILQIIKEEIDAVMNEGEDNIYYLIKQMADGAVQAIGEISAVLVQINNLDDYITEEEEFIESALEHVLDGAPGEDNGGLPKLLQPYGGYISQVEPLLSPLMDETDERHYNQMVDMSYDLAFDRPEDIEDLKERLEFIQSVLNSPLLPALQELEAEHLLNIEMAGRADGAAGGKMEGQNEINPDDLTDEEQDRYYVGFENAQIEQNQRSTSPGQYV
tara:strand:- start:36 stop:701 length:666 start_codon:yes stop_codon:yes gene_type:complete